MANSSTSSELWPDVLGRLLAGDDLPDDLVEATFTQILTGAATDAQIAGLVVGLRAKSESASELAAMVRTTLSFAENLTITPGSPLVDTCGTGGDRTGTVNVSTMAALIAAGAGARVVKHGNRASSSRCGSADVLEELGVAIDLGPQGVARCVEEVGIGFCFAPRFHASFRFAAAARRDLGVTTTFNLLGPLANPARVKHQALGVSDANMAEKMLITLAELGSEHVLVFFGHDGFDELTTTTTSTIFELKAGSITNYKIDPTELGLANTTLESLAGGDANANAAIVDKTLAGEIGPVRDIAVLNAAAALVAADHATDFSEGISQAVAAIDSGAARAILESWVAVSSEARASEA